MNGLLVFAGIMIGGFLGYMLIPDLFLHRLGIGSRKRQYTPGVALTFDDGPDPEITRKVLQVLERENIQAVFFLTGEKALRHPDVVREIAAQGHQIGAHSLDHRYAWLQTPVQTWRQWNECLKILEEIIGEKVQWIRPPWGTFNLTTWLWLKKNRRTAVLWNVEGHDWLTKRTPEEIAKSIVNKVREGSIIVMHDCGGQPGAPQNSLQALEIICRQIVEERMLPWVKLGFPDWSYRRRMTYVLWEKWEQIFARMNKVERINATNLLRLSRIRYKGPELYDREGRLLAKEGDIVGEIHLDSVRLQGGDRDMQKLAVRALRQARDSFPALARYIAEDSKYRELPIFMGQTLIYRGVKGLGFQVEDLKPSWTGRGIGWLQRIIMQVYHPAGKQRPMDRLGTTPKLVWISREDLLRRWLI